jgi:hypothetical protein
MKLPQRAAALNDELNQQAARWAARLVLELGLPTAEESAMIERTVVLPAL